MTPDLGIEIVVEPNVVPRGTVDLRSLDAPPGSVPPAVRIEANGRVVRLAPASLADAPTGALATTAAATAVPATPPPATPAASSSSVHAHQDALALEGAAKVAVSAAEPLGARLRKRASSGALPKVDAPMPPRPASASETGAGPTGGALPPHEDYETAQISGSTSSALGALVKVTLVLVGLTLALILPLLYWSDLLSGPATTQVADARKASPSPAAPSPVAILPSPAPAETAPVPSAAATTKPVEVAQVATSSSSAVALGVNPETPRKPDSPPTPVEPTAVAKVDVEPAKPEGKTEPKVGASVAVENDVDVRKVEGLRAEGVKLYRQGKYDEAIAKFDALLALSPKDSDALFRKAFAMHLKGDLKAAAKAYELAAMSGAPRDARSWNNLGLVRERLGDPSGARAAYERGNAVNPHDANVLTNLGSLEREAHPDKALGYYEQALREDSRHPVARYERAALLALQLRPADEGARRELEALSGEDSPVRAKALDALGQLATRGRRFPDAEKLYRRALEADPSFDEPRLHLGVSLYTSGANDRAEAELRPYVEKHPRSADAWKTLGGALARLDRLPEAKLAYEKALAENDKDVTALYNYALCAERFGNFLFAMQEYERVVQLDPNHWKALANVGRLYHRAGRDEKALEYFNRALALQPNEADLHLHKANALAALRKDQEAREELTSFVKLAPQGDKRVPEAQRALQAGELAPALSDTPPPGERGF